jgi:hypothetical protein
MLKLSLQPDIIINHVTQFLTFAETFAFRLTCLHVNNKVLPKYKDFNLVLKSRLAECFGKDINVDEFCNTLNVTKCKISGSFILQCLIGERWSGESDIDIFYMNLRPQYHWDEVKDEYLPEPIIDKETGETKYIVNGEYNKKIHEESIISKTFIDYMNTTFTLTNERYEDYAFALSALCYPYSYKPKDVKDAKQIDVIGVYHHTSMMSRNEEYLETMNKYNLKEKKAYNSIFDYIKSETDMEFLKCIHDGKKLYVANWESIWKKTCKYFAADVKLIPFYYTDYTPNAEYFVGSYIERMYQRVDKYRKRNLTVHSDIDTVVREPQFTKYLSKAYSYHYDPKCGRGGKTFHRATDEQLDDMRDQIKNRRGNHRGGPPEVMVIHKNRRRHRF